MALRVGARKPCDSAGHHGVRAAWPQLSDVVRRQYPNNRRSPGAAGAEPPGRR